MCLLPLLLLNDASSSSFLLMHSLSLPFLVLVVSFALSPSPGMVSDGGKHIFFVFSHAGRCSDKRGKKKKKSNKTTIGDKERGKRKK